MSNTDCMLSFFWQFNVKAIIYCPTLSCDYKKKCEPGECTCADIGLRCTDLCWLQGYDNSEIVEEDNDVFLPTKLII